MPPNFLVVVLDTARADAFEPYGASPGTTPTVAQMAGDGAALASVFATASWTLPSHASMLTGLLPRTLGLGQAPDGAAAARPILEAQRERMLPEVLRRAGYATAGVSTNLWVADYSGFATGFDGFRVVDSGRQERLKGGGTWGRVRWIWEGARGQVDDGAAEAEATVAEWIDDGPRQPFFWFVNLSECHSPYLPPRPYNDLTIRQRVLAADEARRHLTLEALWRTCTSEFDVPEHALQRMRHLYARSILAMDDWLARVLERMHRAGVLDDTVVVVTSDHGENFGENELIGHSFSLDDRLIKVPVVLLGPGAGTCQLTSLGDLPPMVAGLAGLEDHPWEQRLSEDGVAVAQLDRLAEASDPRVLWAVDSWGLGPNAARRMATSFSCATDGTVKLFRGAGREWLYDLAADPLEDNALALSADVEEKYSTMLPRLRAALDRAERSERQPAAPNEPTPDEIAGLEDRMRLLGYL
jgi:arylsulfatase A-like enzyme